MSKTARVQVRIGPETKAQADALFEHLGLTTSDAIRMFIDMSLEKGALPFNFTDNRTLMSGRAVASGNK